jgi:SAM-dependent methyltransferase
MTNHLGGHFGFTAMVVKTFDYIREKYNIRSMLDIGCGPAGMVEYANYKGVYAIGVDGDPDLGEKPYTIIHDFTTGQLELDETFELVYSTEFVEHVDEQYVDNFMKLFQKGYYVFMSAAPPGQGGHHHVNCKNKDYWIKKFEQYNFEYLPEESEEISKTSNDDLVRKNSMFFRNKTIFTFKDREPFAIHESQIKSSVAFYIEKGGPVD